MPAPRYPVTGAALALILVAAVLVAGCSSPSSSPAPVASPSAPVPAVPEATPAPQAVTTMVMPAPVSPGATPSPSLESVAVTIQNLEFTPASITVKPGTTVTWTNLDTIYHTVTSIEPSPVAFNSGTLPQGDTFRFNFTRAGTYTYICTFHTFMQGTVTVAP
jgi:plastocyanin